jgi:outer membrane protein TolC
LALLLILLLAPAVHAGDGDAAAPPPDPALRLGRVAGDTLFVQRDSVITMALERNEMLAASGAMRDAAAAEAQGAWRAFLPQVQVGSYFLRSDDALSSFGFKLQNRSVSQADFFPPSLNDPGETNNFITRLQLLQPIFNGGSGLGGKRAADAMSRAAEHQHARAAETVRYHAVQAYEGLALAGSFEKVMEAAVASAEGHVRQARSMAANGMATEADVLQAQVFLSGLQQQLITTRHQMALAGENIKLLTAVTTPLRLAVDRNGDAGDLVVPEPGDDPALIAGRNDLLARRAQAEAADRMVAVATGAVLPHVNLSLQRDFYSQDNLFGDDARSWSLGVYATWDIFKGMQNIGEIKKARADRRAAQHMVDFETRQASVQAREAWLNLTAAREKVDVARGAVEAAREGLRIVTNQYREGLAGMVDLLDTQAAATMAEGRLVHALHDYQVGLAQLQYAGAATGPATAPTTPAPEDENHAAQ